MSVASASGSHEVITDFIDKQALERKYHSLFQWEASNANKFFSLFGEDMKKSLALEAKQDPPSSAISDFLFLGATRNELVHENFAAFSLDVTADDIMRKFRNASTFVDWFRSKLEAVTAEAEPN